MVAKRYVPKPMPVVGPGVGIIGAVAALIIGIFTHVLWDSFPRVDRWGTNHLSVLREKIDTQPIYSVLQELSSVLGLGAVLVGIAIGVGVAGWCLSAGRRGPRIVATSRNHA